MELWIRSQDGERLTRCHDLRLYYAKQENVWVIEDCDDLGYYKTKERALQILDEIQYILQPVVIAKEPKINYDNLINSLTEDIMIKSSQEIEFNLKEAGQFVYQMPKE